MHPFWTIGFLRKAAPERKVTRSLHRQDGRAIMEGMVSQIKGDGGN